MEQNLPVIAKRVWSIVRAVLFMMKKGIFSKRKFMLHLNLLLKRGKIASTKAMANLLLFHHRHHLSSPPPSKVASAASEYEFSCSNTPNYIFPFNLATTTTNKKKNNISFFTCTHAPPTHDDIDTMNAVKVVLEMLNNNENMSVVAASPMLPGFGQTPLVRQLRVTDSPFPLRDVDDDDDNSSVDKAAEDFIQRFYKDLKMQNKGLTQL